MPTVAEQLRQAREAQNLNIQQVAEITKIKTDHLRALEEGHYDAFTAPVYIRGFVRAYASVLKLDPARIAADLEVELRQTKRFREPPPLTVIPKTPVDFIMLQVSRMNWRIAAALLGLIVVVILAIAGFRGRSDDTEKALKDLGPGLYQPPTKHAGDTLPVPPPPPARK